MRGLDERGLARARARAEAFVAGASELTGLELYHALEQCTELVRFHTVLRRGAANRCRNGLQQSYGDHNRLLLLGLDMLEAGDVEWYLGRLEEPGAVDRREIEDCVARVRALGLGNEVRLALWLAAALHDYGMVEPTERGLDVENAAALCRPVLDALCAPPLRGLVEFAIRNHDFIKDVWSGEVPAGFVAGQLAALPAPLRGTALAALGMIQVAGAASLGEGRLSRARLEICRRCFDGTALADASAGTRLARLMADDGLEVGAASRREAAAWIEALGPGAREQVVDLLDAALLHGWQRARALAGAARDGAEGRHVMRSLLVALAARWAGESPRPEHVVLDERVGERLREGRPDQVDPVGRLDRVALLNGTRAVVVR